MSLNVKLIESKLLNGPVYAIDTGRGNKPFLPQIKEMTSIRLRADDVVVDIGAHIGVFSLYAARNPVTQVIAYEPDPSNFQVLSLNRFDLPNFEIKQAAITGQPQPQDAVELYISKGPGLRNSIRKIRGRQNITVNAVAYAEAVRDATIVKVDVEGAEYDYPLVQPHLRGLIIDFHPVGSDWIDRVKEILKQFEAAGFSVVDKPKFKKGWNASWDACATLEKT